MARAQTCRARLGAFCELITKRGYRYVIHLLIGGIATGLLLDIPEINSDYLTAISFVYAWTFASLVVFLTELISIGCHLGTFGTKVIYMLTLCVQLLCWVFGIVVFVVPGLEWSAFTREYELLKILSYGYIGLTPLVWVLWRITIFAGYDYGVSVPKQTLVPVVEKPDTTTVDVAEIDMEGGVPVATVDVAEIDMEGGVPVATLDE